MGPIFKLNKIGGGAGVAALTASYTSGAAMPFPPRRMRIRVHAEKNGANTSIRFRLVDQSPSADAAVLASWGSLPIFVDWQLPPGSAELADPRELKLCTAGNSQEVIGYLDQGPLLTGVLTPQAYIDGADASASNKCFVEFQFGLSTDGDR